MGWRIERKRPSRRSAASLAFGACLALGAAALAGPGVAGSPLALPAWHGDGGDYALRFVLPPSRVAPLVQAEPAPPRDTEPEKSRVAVLTGAEPEVIAAAPTPAASPQPAAGKLPVPTSVRLARRAKLPGVIALSYSIGAAPDDGAAIEVEKPVWIGEAEAGKLAVRIDSTARLYAHGGAVAALLAQSGAGAAPPLDDAFVSFSELRALGIELRYDAARDRLVLAPPAA